ncbi:MULTISPECIES: hypothetical protein [Burkholderia cepacia complex]|uniref:Secreted protein n=2 Tax=Burkholderia TaxID=32008 RepID=A0A1B4LA65_9BURK|nr:MULTISPECIES: hypothetical protein [Burkholderia cepacia complex]AOJ74074.1 hypothetical protein WJ35_02585 [Burkholderia ubonensis]
MCQLLLALVFICSSHEFAIIHTIFNAFSMGNGMDISKLTGQVVGILVEHLSVVGFDITVHEVVHQIALGATCAPLCKTARIQRAVFLWGA